MQVTIKARHPGAEVAFAEEKLRGIYQRAFERVCCRFFDIPRDVDINQQQRGEAIEEVLHSLAAFLILLSFSSHWPRLPPAQYGIKRADRGLKHHSFLAVLDVAVT